MSKLQRRRKSKKSEKPIHSFSINDRVISNTGTKMRGTIISCQPHKHLIHVNFDIDLDLARGVCASTLMHEEDFDD